MRSMSMIFALAVLACAPAVRAQTSTVTRDRDPKTTQAYSMLVERRVKVQAELEMLLSEYTSNWPPAKKLQAELDALKTEMTKMSGLDQSLIPRLTAGVGALLLRKTTLICETKMLAEEQSPSWPPLREKQRELELLDREIQEILR